MKIYLEQKTLSMGSFKLHEPSDFHLSVTLMQEKEHLESRHGEQSGFSRRVFIFGKKKASCECVTELHALWDSFTEVWAALRLY